MIKVSLLDTLRSGSFGPVQLGMSHAQVVELLGPPDYSSQADKHMKYAYIDKYGDIEFHYSREPDCLYLIFEDSFETLEGGRSVDLDPWIVHGMISRNEVLTQLRKQGIPYQQIVRQFWDGVIVITEGGVELGFIENDEQFGLEAFSLASAGVFTRALYIPLCYKPIGRITHFGIS